MKRKNRIVLPVLALTLALCLAGCGSSGSTAQTGSSSAAAETKADAVSERSTYTVAFSCNYEGAPEDILTEVEAEQAPVKPADPERSGYAFTGWYADAECQQEADFEVAILENTTYYAGWEKTAAAVTFDPNYEGAEVSITEVNAGSEVSTPVTPEREGYYFTGWYTDAELTASYDFSTPVEEDLTLYAAWEVDDGNTCRITYEWNTQDKGTFDQVRVKKLGFASAPEIQLDGWYLEGWYLDPECTEKFDFASTRIRQDYTLYANWLQVFCFEAEYTDLTGLEGMGYSGNASGTKMIEDGKSRSASGDYYVGWLYNEGLQLSFHVNSSTDTDNALIGLSLSAEFYDITLTSTNFTVAVNGEALGYQNIEFTGTSEVELPFTTTVLDVPVSLKAGENVITLTVTNTEKKTGTIYATAPMVDCVYVYSDTEVEWGEGFPMTSNIR